MSIVYSRNSRRQFLVGSGQALLALPFLPSLLPSYASAQTSIGGRRIMNFMFDHHNEESFWPNPAIATTPVGSIGIRERLLSSLGNTSSTVISSLMSNPLYNTLLAQNQITMIRGLGNHQSGGNGHATRAMGGHCTEECGDTSQVASHRSTYDYLVETSPTVYANAASNITKVIRIDLGGCWTYVQRVGTRSLNPGAYGYDDILTMYNTVFGSLTGGTVPVTDLTNTRKTNILNRVFPAFQNYRSNRKISSEDRIRLDQHMGFLADLQRSITVVLPPPSASCVKPSSSGMTGATKMQINYLYADLMVAAFKCGLTKFGAMQFEIQSPTWFPGYTGNESFHGIIHGDQGVAAQRNAYSSMHSFGNNLIADRFLSPMNVLEGDTGRTYLDNMITTSLSSLGMDFGGHTDFDLQHMIFGSMGGRLRAGRYYHVPAPNGIALANNAFIMTLLNLMGVPESEYVLNSSVAGRGFGFYVNTGGSFGSRIYTPITEMLA